MEAKQSLRLDRIGVLRNSPTRLQLPHLIWPLVSSALIVSYFPSIPWEGYIIYLGRTCFGISSGKT